jgi:hypothetical protein
MKRLIALLLITSGCSKQSSPPAALPGPHPTEVSIEGAYHAVRCGTLTAVWSGSADALKGLPAPVPEAYGVESLAFRFADGSQQGFVPPGQLFFSDWQFEVFAPDCSALALKVDHYGPIHLVRTEALSSYLQGHSQPLVLEVPKEAAAPVYGEVRWVSPSQLELVTEAGGGAEVFRATVQDGAASLERIFMLAEAPKGVRRGDAGWEGR